VKHHYEKWIYNGTNCGQHDWIISEHDGQPGNDEKQKQEKDDKGRKKFHQEIRQLNR